MKRSRFRILGWCGLAALLLVIGGAGLAALNRNRLARYAVRSALMRQTGAGVRLDAVEMGLRDSSVRLQSLVISNPPGFGPEPLLAMPELFLRLDPAAASTNVLRLLEARIHLASIHVIVDREGRTNLAMLTREAGTGAGPESATALLQGMRFGGVDRLTLTLGRITFTDERDARRNVNFDLGITNRTLTNVTGLGQLLPLALEVVFRSGWQTDFSIPALLTNPPALPVR